MSEFSKYIFELCFNSIKTVLNNKQANWTFKCIVWGICMLKTKTVMFKVEGFHLNFTLCFFFFKSWNQIIKWTICQWSSSSILKMFYSQLTMMHWFLWAKVSDNRKIIMWEYIILNIFYKSTVYLLMSKTFLTREELCSAPLAELQHRPSSLDSSVMSSHFEHGCIIYWASIWVSAYSSDIQRWSIISYYQYLPSILHWLIWIS